MDPYCFRLRQGWVGFVVLIGLAMALLSGAAADSSDRADISASAGSDRTAVTPLARALAASRDGDSAGAYEIIHSAALAGDRAAQTMLGDFLFAGIGIAADRDAAMSWYQRAAEQNDPDALFVLGIMSRDGGILSADRATARDFLSRAAAAGHDDAHAELGRLLSGDTASAEDYEAARYHLDAAAAVGHREASFRLAMLHLDGRIAAADPARAAELLRAIADDFPEAHYNLAVMLENGIGVKVDLAAARDHYTAAAAAGHDDAHAELGRMLSGDTASAEDYEAARYHLDAAAAVGHREASFRLAMLHHDGRIAAADPARAVELLRAIADDFPEAHYRLAVMFEDGIGIAPDLAAARDHYTAAAAADHRDAQAELGRMLSEDTASAEDYEVARHHLAAAADAGHGEASFLLAMLHLDGRFIDASPARAAELLRAIADDLPEAHYNLAVMLENGIGVKVDLAAARDHYTKAANASIIAALNALGRLYLRDSHDAHKTITADAAKSANYYRIAADLGSAVAQNRLARFYLVGHGVSQDVIIAYQWYILAAGSLGSNPQLDAIFAQMTPEQQRQGKNHAVYWSTHRPSAIPAALRRIRIKMIGAKLAA